MLRHSTWAGTYACTPRAILKPQSVEAVQSIVKDAVKANTTVTVVGASHSPSTLTMTQGWVVSLDKLDKTLDMREHDGYVDVTVEAGKRLYNLNDELALRGLALQNLGSISEQSVAGVISTGTHGSSAYHGIIAEQIVDLTLVLADGSLCKCSDTEKPELFKAALLSFGKLGIIVKATVRTVPAFKLECKQQTIDLGEFLSDEVWNKFFTSAEYHRVWWYPYSRKCVLWRAERTEKHLTAPQVSFYGTWLGRSVYQALLWVAVRIAPSLTPAIERWLFRNQFRDVPQYGSPEAEHQQPVVDRSDQAINMDCLFSQFVNEWAMPLNNGRDVIRKLETEILKYDYYVHAPIEIRVSNTTRSLSQRKDTKTLISVNGTKVLGAIPGNLSRPYLDTSPQLPYAEPQNVTYDNLTLNINATMYRPFRFDAPTEQWYTAFESICDAAGGKPHWAKNFLGTNKESKAIGHHMRGIKDQIDRWYGNDVDAWRALRRKLDPNDTFVGNREWMAINGLL